MPQTVRADAVIAISDDVGETAMEERKTERNLMEKLGSESEKLYLACDAQIRYDSATKSWNLFKHWTLPKLKFARLSLLIDIILVSYLQKSIFALYSFKELEYTLEFKKKRDVQLRFCGKKRRKELVQFALEQKIFRKRTNLLLFLFCILFKV